MSSVERTAAAFREMLDELVTIERRIHERPEQPLDERTLVEGYRYLFTILQVGIDAYVWADPAAPHFVEIVGPLRKWGGDNADSVYNFAPIDPRRTYRVRGRRGDAVYLSLTVYGGPDDGRWSERIVGTVNDRALTFDAGGNFEVVLSPEEHPGTWLKLEPDAVCAITRDYLVETPQQRRAEWQIEAIGNPPGPERLDDETFARRLRAALTWVREQGNLVPVPNLTGPNEIGEPYGVPKVAYGWVAGDASYAPGAFALAEDEALVIEGRSPECAFWNLCLWNPFLHTFNYERERVTINGGQVRYEDDGSWRIVVAHRDPGHPNWVSTAGHPKGLIWLRWFYPSETPSRPTSRVVPIDQVPR